MTIFDDVIGEAEDEVEEQAEENKEGMQKEKQVFGYTVWLCEVAFEFCVFT